MSDTLPGYSDKVRDLLERLGVSIGCRLRLYLAPNTIVEGLLMPKHEFSAPNTIVIKLDNGYNIGVEIESVKNIEVVECRELPRTTVASIPFRHDLPRTRILGCGGTIASKVEYEKIGRAHV